MKTRMALALVLCGVLLASAAPAAAKMERGAPTAPGKYTDWQDEIDQLEVVETFSAADYGKVVVEGFDTAETALPEADDNSYAPTKQVLADVAGPFAEGLRGELRGKAVEVGQAGGAGEGKAALVVRGKVLEMDPGNRAARYWGGFGAGAARAHLSGEVVDSETGKVLLRFEQERRSGVGVAGGDYLKLMQRSLRAIGEDLALILQAF